MILSAKYELMRKNFRNFAETEFTTEIQEKLDKEGGFDTEMYKKMARYGFPGIKIPVKYGGQGGDSLAYVLMNEEFARICPTLLAEVLFLPAAMRNSFRNIWSRWQRVRSTSALR